MSAPTSNVRCARHALMILSSLSVSLACAPACAGVIDGTLDPVVRVCFVGNAVTAKPLDVKFVWDHLKVYENYGHIKFVLFNHGQCPAPKRSADGKFDVHEGDLRIGIAGTLDLDGKTPISGTAIAGKGCAEKPGEGSWWSNVPGNRNKPQFRSCRLTTFVKGGLPLNLIMHELGHAMGLIHEHERRDVPLSDPMVARCYKEVPYFGKGLSPGGEFLFVTPYDRYSVMHYPAPPGSTCQLGAEKDKHGLSYFDKLTIRILYPQSSRIAQFIGATVAAVGERVVLRNEWAFAGALVENVVKNPAWTVTRGNRKVVQQKTPDFGFVFNEDGLYSIDYAFTDAKGRSFANTSEIRILPPEALLRLRAATTGSNMILF